MTRAEKFYECLSGERGERRIIWRWRVKADIGALIGQTTTGGRTSATSAGGFDLRFPGG